MGTCPLRAAATVSSKEEAGCIPGVGHLELFGTKLTHHLSGDARPHKEGLSCEATVDLLECNPEVILQGLAWGEIQRTESERKRRHSVPWDAKERAVRVSPHWDASWCQDTRPRREGG